MSVDDSRKVRNGARRIKVALTSRAGALVTGARRGHLGRMDFTSTVGAAAAAAVLTGLFGWLGARPPDLQRGPRLLPYRFLMVLSATILILMLVHLMNLAGVSTGPPTRS